MSAADGCLSCRNEAAVDALPPREAILVAPRWRVAHSFDVALPGWLVVLPRRHITSLAELDDDEATSLGPLLARASRALVEVTGCVKTYVMLFAEKEGFSHLHFHVVPRAAHLPDELLGPRVMGYLGRPEEEWISEPERDRLALELRAAMGA